MSQPYDPNNPYQQQPPPQYPPAYTPQPGYPPQQHTPQPYVQQHVHYGTTRPTNGMAVAALVMGIVGILSCGTLSILAVVFGHVGQSQIKRTGEEGNGMAMAGLIMGYLMLAFWLIWVLFYFVIGIALLGIGGASSY